MHSRISAVLLSLLILSFPLTLSSQAQNQGQGIGGTDKVSQEQGPQGKGNAYGRAPRDDRSGLGGMTSAAPLPPILAILLLGLGIGLKTVHDKRKKTGPASDPTA